MAPCKPAKSIKIRVTRHNAQRLGPSLTSTVRAVATKEKKLVQLPPPVAEQPGVTGQSLENASEWNSLLLSARAQRGPFWDVSTQQFLVERGSEVYYDPTPLLEATRSLTSNNKDPQSSKAGQSSSQHLQQQQRQQVAQTSSHQQQLQAQQLAQQQRQAAFATQQQFAGYMGANINAGGGGTPVMHSTPTRPGVNVSGAGPGAGMPFGGTPGSATPGHGQFFGDMGTPTRPPGGMMNGMGAVGTQDIYGRRITRGMSDGFPGFAG